MGPLGGQLGSDGIGWFRRGALSCLATDECVGRDFLGVAAGGAGARVTHPMQAS